MAELEVELSTLEALMAEERAALSPHRGAAPAAFERDDDSLPCAADTSEDAKGSACPQAAGDILKYMLQQSPALDHVFHALADPARRGMLERLSRGPASVSQLAEPLPMSLSAVVQHLAVLEGSGLVTSQKVGRVRTCTLDTTALTQAEKWINERRMFWEGRFDALGAFLAETRPADEA